MGVRIESLYARADGLDVDRDDLLGKFAGVDALLIRLAPQPFPYESHTVFERVICLRGRLALETETGERFDLAQGEMAIIAPGLRHRFAADSEATILTLYGSAEGDAAPERS